MNYEFLEFLNKFIDVMSDKKIKICKLETEVFSKELMKEIKKQKERALY